MDSDPMVNADGAPSAIAVRTATPRGSSELASTESADPTGGTGGHSVTGSRRGTEVTDRNARVESPPVDLGPVNRVSLPVMLPPRNPTRL